MKLFYSFLSCLILMSCTSVVTQNKKINGVSFVSNGSSISEKDIAPVIGVNANYVALMPFGFVRSIDNPNIQFNSKRQWFGETSEGVLQYAEEFRKKNVKIMLKPQIWVWNGVYTGTMKMKNEKDWKTLEISYSKFILKYAEVAKRMNADIFCIGTELELFVKHRPEYWIALITKIKTIYKGKLTYAANWDEYKRTPFWSYLDFIGVDAYFPVSDKKTPLVEDCLKKWDTHKLKLKTLSEKHNKQILFTEYGYRSVDYSGKEPWNFDRNMTTVNLEAQNNTTKALFKAVWHEAWFAGGFIWKWFIDYENVGGENNNQFTPQNKPVEAILRAHYQK